MNWVNNIYKHIIILIHFIMRANKHIDSRSILITSNLNNETVIIN